jgi:hypothetical protein
VLDYSIISQPKVDDAFRTAGTSRFESISVYWYLAPKNAGIDCDCTTRLLKLLRKVPSSPASDMRAVPENDLSAILQALAGGTGKDFGPISRNTLYLMLSQALLTTITV